MPAQHKYDRAACGHPSNRTRIECASCARKRYYQTNKAKILEANEDYIKNNRPIRRAIEQRYKEKVGITPPRELKELRRAIKRLEKALGKANYSGGTSQADQ